MFDCFPNENAAQYNAIRFKQYVELSLRIKRFDKGGQVLLVKSNPKATEMLFAKGKSFGDLIVQDDYSLEDKKEGALVPCKCTCGEPRMVQPRNLLDGSVTACYACMRKRSYHHFEGQVIDGYRVLRLLPYRASNRAKLWLIECVNCQRRRQVRSNKLSSGHLARCICHGPHTNQDREDCDRN